MPVGHAATGIVFFKYYDLLWRIRLEPGPTDRHDLLKHHLGCLGLAKADPDVRAPAVTTSRRGACARASRPVSARADRRCTH